MNRRSIFNDKEAVEAGAHGGRGGRVHVELSRGDAGGTANREGHPRPLLRKSPETEDVREGPMTTGAQTTELRHHNGEFVNDVRVSPIDEGVGVVEEDELSCAARRPRTASGSPPRSRRTTRSRRRDSQNCRHRAPRRCPADLLLGAPWVRFVSEEVYQEVSPREPGENDSACVPKLKGQEITIFKKKPSPSRDDTSDEVPKLQLKIGSVRGLMNATLFQRIPRSTMIAQLGGPNIAELSRVLRDIMIVASAGRRTCE